MVGGGKVGKRVAGTLIRAAEATLDCAEENGVAFDKAKTEAILLSKRRKKHTESVRVGEIMTSSSINTSHGGSESGSTPK